MIAAAATTIRLVFAVGVNVAFLEAFAARSTFVRVGAVEVEVSPAPTSSASDAFAVDNDDAAVGAREPTGVVIAVADESSSG